MPWDQALSFIAGVFAVVIGQLLGQRFQREADERRWERQEADRRRLRAEEAAELILDEVVKTTRMCHAFVLAEGFRPDAYPPQEMVSPAFDAINRAATRVPDDAVKLAAEQAADLLFYSSPHDMGLTTWSLIGVVEKELRAVVSAYLTGRLVPATPGMNTAHVALDKYQGWIAKQLAEDEEGGEQPTKPEGSGGT
jgi:hypothetical protein